MTKSRFENYKEEPKLKRLTVDRVTEAGLVDVLASQDGRIMYVSSEPTFLDEAAGNKSQSRPQIDILLKGYSGEPIIQDRVTTGHKAIDAAHISMGVTVQPDSLRQYAGTHHAGEAEARGFLARFLFALPEPPGPKTFATPPVPSDVAERFHHNMQTLWRLDDTARVVTLSQGAEKLLLDFARELERSMHDREGPLSQETAWASKLRGQVLRIAGVLHALDAAPAADLEQAITSPIPTETMQRAIEVGEYLIGHALAAFGHMRMTTASRDARVLLDWLTKRGEPHQSRRDIQRGLIRTVGSNAQRLGAALEHLVYTGHIRASGNGFDVHPSVTGSTTTSTTGGEG